MIKTIDNFDFKGKRALIRVDFNVPVNESLEVTDTNRIEASKPTIDKILSQGGSVVLMTHFGRPKSKEDKYSLRHIIPTVEKVLGHGVKFCPDCTGQEAESMSRSLKSGEILLLENVRFYKEEEGGDESFAKQLSALGDIYVNDAFGTAHRAHASTCVVAKFFPQSKCFGYLLAKEIQSIDRVMKTGKKPITAILGGSKVSSKITIIENILPKVDNMIIGGGMAFTFIKAQGGSIGNSICEDDKLDLALEILDKAKSLGVNIVLPVDVLCGKEFSNDTQTQVFMANQIPEGWQGLDCGERSIEKNREVILNSRTILWNGPVGVFEMPTFSKGTIATGQAIAQSTKDGAFSLVGGGDSVSAAKQFGFDTQVSYVSTGGGAMLESLEGKTLAGIAAIEQ